MDRKQGFSQYFSPNPSPRGASLTFTKLKYTWKDTTKYKKIQLAFYQLSKIYVILISKVLSKIFQVDDTVQFL